MLQFKKGANGNALSFPLTASAIAALHPSKLTSPRAGRSHGLVVPNRLRNITLESEALKEVQEVRAQVARGEMPWSFLARHWPTTWGRFDRFIPEPLRRQRLSERRPAGLAYVVHMDSPVDLGLAIGDWLRSEGAKATNLQAIEHNAFLDMVPGPIATMARRIDDALDRVFEAKYYFGVPRPEEVSGINCTQYPEGCPTHPSFPAGHGAAAGATGRYFQDEWQLSPRQLKIVRASCYHWAQYRTLAGVHYAEDNLAGLAIGGLS